LQSPRRSGAHLREHASTTSSAVQVLLCRVDGHFCVWPLTSIGEVMRPLPLRFLPSVPDYVQGVAMIRGRAVPVLHVGLLLGATVASPAGRFVTLRTPRGTIALALGEVTGIRALTAADLGDLPPLLSGVSSEVLQAIGTLDAELLFSLQAARLGTESLWQALAELA
jgi:chemotaxis signal transduction protein